MRKEMINLTGNEKKVLRILLSNSRITDSEISKKLKISSQAVGKIRRKLEKTVIKSYSVEVDYSKLGINLFAISLAKMTVAGIEKGELEVEREFNKCPNMLQVYRLPNQNITHLILYGFSDIEDLDSFFHSRDRNSVLRFIENKEIFTFSGHSRLKNNAKDLLEIMIEGKAKKESGEKFHEIKKFKKRIV